METQPAGSLPQDLQAECAAGDVVLQRAQRGDLAAFRELMHIHKVRVYSMALRFMGNSADAEEVAQDVFLQLHGALGQIAAPEHLKRWLLRTVSHRCIDRLRNQGSRPRLVSIDVLPEAVQAAAEERGDPLVSAKVRRLLLELSPEARAVLLLRFQEELVPSEIATVLAMSLNTVKSHLRRSLEWLRTQLPGVEHES